MTPRESQVAPPADRWNRKPPTPTRAPEFRNATLAEFRERRQFAEFHGDGVGGSYSIGDLPLAGVGLPDVGRGPSHESYEELY